VGVGSVIVVLVVAAATIVAVPQLRHRVPVVKGWFGTDPSSAALVGTLQQFFADGCEGSCSDATEPASAFIVKVDAKNPTWARWTINDPNIGTASGYAQADHGNWQVAAGPGSDQVGCSESDPVPAQVLSAFGATCQGAVTAPATPTAPQVSAQEAYEVGEAHGKTAIAGISGPEAQPEQRVCALIEVPAEYSQAGLSGDWIQGCEAGYQAGLAGPPFG
jgi:hypothetical protein